MLRFSAEFHAETEGRCRADRSAALADAAIVRRGIQHQYGCVVVKVPVLFEQIAVTVPRVSTAGRRPTKAHAAVGATMLLQHLRSEGRYEIPHPETRRAHGVLPVQRPKYGGRPTMRESIDAIIDTAGVLTAIKIGVDDTQDVSGELPGGPCVPGEGIRGLSPRNPRLDIWGAGVNDIGDSAAYARAAASTAWFSATILARSAGSR